MTTLVRVSDAPQIADVPAQSWGSFLSATWTVSPPSNRMGLRLSGPILEVAAGEELLPQGTLDGTIQLPPGGQPIILGPDRPITGGYPQIATVISADLDRLARTRPGDELRFMYVSRQQAATVWKTQRRTPGESPGVCIDLNADVGEGCDDDAILPHVTSVNIACGGHAGDPETMSKAVEAARRRGLAIGAHPGYPDRGNFGRRPLDLPLPGIERLVREQVIALAEVAARQGTRLHHVKPHGALYHQAAREAGIARAVAGAVASVDPTLRLIGPASSRLLAAGRELGLAGAAEGFADRRYLADGSLAPRAAEGGVVASPDFASAQAVAIARGDPVSGLDGTWLRVQAETLCLHGDTPGAAAIAREVHGALTRSGATLLAPWVTAPNSP